MSQDFPCDTVVKNSPVNGGDTRDMGSISRSGRSPGGRNGNLLQYSCLGNSVDRGNWWAAVHGITVRHDCVTKHAHEPRLYLYLLLFGVMSIPQNFLFPDPRVLVNQIGNTGNFRLVRPL